MLSEIVKSESESDIELMARAVQPQEASVQAKTKVMADIIRDFLFADDSAAINAVSEADRHCRVDTFSTACTNFGLTISTNTTEVLHQPAPGKPYVEPNITVNGQRLNTVNRFTYRGNTLSQNATIDDEVNRQNCESKRNFRQTTCQCLEQKGNHYVCRRNGRYTGQ